MGTLGPNPGATFASDSGVGSVAEQCHTTNKSRGRTIEE